MPDSRRDLWRAYADLRGIENGCAETDAHAGRLHEIFAEDFRVLFGGEYARCGGEVENHDLAPPHQVSGLKEFFLSLIEQWRGVVRVAAYPNPFQAGVVVRGISVDETLEISEVRIHDAAGRMVRVIKPQGNRAGRVVWDGEDHRGRHVAPGLYFVTVVTPGRVSIHKVVRAPR
jgi:hypothetical protein